MLDIPRTPFQQSLEAGIVAEGVPGGSKKAAWGSVERLTPPGPSVELELVEPSEVPVRAPETPQGGEAVSHALQDLELVRNPNLLKMFVHFGAAPSVLPDHITIPGADGHPQGNTAGEDLLTVLAS